MIEKYGASFRKIKGGRVTWSGSIDMDLPQLNLKCPDTMVGAVYAFSYENNKHGNQRIAAGECRRSERIGNCLLVFSA